MHEYYRKNQEKFKKDMDNFLCLIKNELETELKKPYSEIQEEVWECYRNNFLENFAYIGGDKASGTRNLTGAFSFVALGEVCTGYGMTLEKWGYLTTLSYRRFFEKMPGFMKKAAGKLFQNTSLTTRLLKMKDKKNAKNAQENPGSFETKVQPPQKEYPVIYHNLVCPLADFARKYGYMEYMPYICNLDYVMFEVLKVPFYREKTCVNGDDYCDFKMKKNAPVVPAWPCHGLDPDDPLR